MNTSPAATIAAAVLAVTALSACSPKDMTSVASSSTAAPSAAAGDYQLVQYPNANGFSSYYDQLNSAKSSIAMEMYSLKDASVNDALIAAHKRGVKVTVLLNAAFGGSKSNKASFTTLKNGGVDVKWAPKGTIFHIKTTVIDNRLADVSTANLNPANYANTRDATVITTNPEQVKAIADTFAADFAGTKTSEATHTAPGLLFSPKAKDSMLNAISAAKHSIRYSSEELADDDVVAALAADAKRGVSCTVLMTQDKAWNTEYTTLSKAGCAVKLIADSKKTTYIHEKIVLTDDANLLIGSQNASTASLVRNRELSIALDSRSAAPIVSAIASTFDSDVASATTWK